MNKWTLISSVGPLAVAVAACGSGAPGSNNTGGGQPGVVQPAAGEAEPKFSRTIVVLNPDGTQTVTTDMITRQEQLDEQARHAALRNGTRQVDVLSLGDGGGYPDAGLTYESCADDYYAALWNGQGETESEICFYNTGLHWDYVDLDNSNFGNSLCCGGSTSSGCCGSSGSCTGLWSCAWGSNQIASYETGDSTAALTSSSAKPYSSCVYIGDNVKENSPGPGRSFGIGMSYLNVEGSGFNLANICSE
jgi:hypothetical protein